MVTLDLLYKSAEPKKIRDIELAYIVDMYTTASEGMTD